MAIVILLVGRGKSASFTYLFITSHVLYHPGESIKWIICTMGAIVKVAWLKTIIWLDEHSMIRCVMVTVMSVLSLLVYVCLGFFFGVNKYYYPEPLAFQSRTRYFASRGTRGGPSIFTYLTVFEERPLRVGSQKQPHRKLFGFGQFLQ